MIPKIDCAKVVDYLAKRLRWYVFEYARRECAVLGLSGGIDSSVVTYLSVRALGKEKVYVYLLPSAATPKEDLDDALEVINRLEISSTNWQLINIQDVVDSFEGLFPAVDRLERGNIMARTRMIILHHKAAAHKALVIGTGDKSEILMGYFTKHGDAGVDVLPIAGLYKTHVREVAEYLGVAERIIRKPPSPALWPGQTAEGELGVDYGTLDTILYLTFDKWLSEDQISQASGIPAEVVKRVLSKVKSTQHKRHLPEVFKVAYRDVGSDWPYPREW